MQIARDWNTKDAASGYAGYVTRFHVRSDVLARYPLQTAGARRHQEYWIPAEEMDALQPRHRRPHRGGGRVPRGGAA